MNNRSFPLCLRVDPLEKRSLREINLSNKLKLFCHSEIRRDKALSATGYKSEVDAAKWLLSHADDPGLDSPCIRVFCLFLCVRSDLDIKVREFWEENFMNEGWNHAHEFPPHITLLSNLKVPENKVLLAHASYDKLLHEHGALLDLCDASLKLVTSADFIGYIISNEQTNENLKKFCQLFVQELINVGIHFEDDPVEKRKYAFHMSLAYGFQSSSRIDVSGLQDTYDMKTNPSILWTLDFFSSDYRMSTPYSELYEAQTTLEVNDNLFSKLSLENKLHCDGSLDHFPFECGQLISKDILSSPASSVGMGRTPDSDSFPPILENPFTDLISPSNPLYVPNTLAYTAGDHVLLVGSCNIGAMCGIPVGLNLMTGVAGAFNLASTRRIPKSYAWVTHRSAMVVEPKEYDNAGSPLHNVFVAPSKILSSFSSSVDFGEPLAVVRSHDCPSVGTVSSNGGGGGGVGGSCVNASGNFCSKLLSRNCRRKSSSFSAQPSVLVIANSSKTAVKTPSPPASSNSFFGSRFFWGSLLSTNGSGANPNQHPEQHPLKSQRRLFVMRHGERVDNCFGRAWTTRCIDRRGLYRRPNLNMPPRLPLREDINDHSLDPPLTQVGLFVAASCGQALAEAGVRFSACYVSPALRCVQTACQLLRSAEQGDLAVRIEPQLLEWLGWYAGNLPNFLSRSALMELGFNVDTSYTPLSCMDAVNLQESVQQYYARSSNLIQSILDQHQTKDANILIVGHAATLYASTRCLLRKKRFRSGGNNSNLASSAINGHICMNDVEELQKRCSSVPYCGLLCALEGGRRWHLEEPPISPLTHGQNSDFDWRQFYGSSVCSFGIR